MTFQLLKTIMMKPFSGCLLDYLIGNLYLSISPWMSKLRRSVFNAQSLT